MNTKKWMKLLCALLALLTMLSMPALALSSSATVSVCRVTEDLARLREKVDDKENYIALRKGDYLFKIGQTDAFYKVRTLSGKIGYVYSEYVSVEYSTKYGNIYECNGKTPYYTEKSGKPVKKGTLSSGTYVTLLQTSGTWAKVRKLDGSVCYVKKSKLKKA